MTGTGVDTPAGHRYYVSRTKVQHAGLLAAVLMLIGGGVLLAGPDAVPDAGLIGALQLGLAAAVAVSAAYFARDRSPHLVVDDEGIWFRDWRVGKLPWPEISDAYLGGSKARGYLCVRLRESERLLAVLSEDERKRLARNPLVHLPELRVPNGALNASLDEIEAVVRARIGARPA